MYNNIFWMPFSDLFTFESFKAWSPWRKVKNFNDVSTSLLYWIQFANIFVVYTCNFLDKIAMPKGSKQRNGVLMNIFRAFFKFISQNIKKNVYTKEFIAFEWQKLRLAHKISIVKCQGLTTWDFLNLVN